MLGEGEQVGRYRVVRRLGAGGMAEVYLAHDVSLERDVALKLLYQDPARIGLRDEAKALAALRHPNIVTIYEIGVHEGRDFIAMEYLPGQPLRMVLAELPRNEKVMIVAKVAEAVAAAHKAGILHRDIKPENVIVSADGGEVKVVDFGIASRLSEPKRKRAATAREAADSLKGHTIPYADPLEATVVDSNTQTPFGTPAYMAPEVLVGDAATESSDVYSIGVILYESLAGRRPHGGSDLVEMISRVIDEDPTPIEDPLGPLVMRMIARSSAERPTLDEVTRSLVRRMPTVAAGSTAPGTTRSPVARAPTPRPMSQAGGKRKTSRGPVVVAAVVVAAAAAIGAVLYLRSTTPPTQKLVSVRPVRSNVAGNSTVIDPVHMIAAEIAAATCALIEEASSNLKCAVDSPNADLVVSVTLSQAKAGDPVRATVALERGGAKGTAEPEARTVEGPTFAAVLNAVAVLAATEVSPSPSLERSSERSVLLYQKGKPEFDNGQYDRARPWFELAVEADPHNFPAWSALLLMRSWGGLDEATFEGTFRGAVEAAGDNQDERDYVEIVRAIVSNDIARAWDLAQPLEKRTRELDASPRIADIELRRDIKFAYGDAAFHDGDFDEAFGVLEPLARTAHYPPATVHAWQYLVARRDDRASFYLGLGHERPDWSEFSQRHYDRLAEHALPPFSWWSQVVLDRPLTPAMEEELNKPDLPHWVDRIGLMVGRGEDDEAKKQIAERLAGELAQPGEAAVRPLETLCEIAIAAGWKDEARTLVAAMGRTPPHERRHYRRLSALAAALTGDASLIPAGRGSTRDRQIEAAVRSHISGDLSSAVEQLQSLVANPGLSWDYAERALLVRDLRALGRDPSAVCADTLEPALFNDAYPAVRRLCKTP